MALVAITTVGPVKLKQRVLLSRAPAFDGKVMTEPLWLSRACVCASDHSSANKRTSQASSLDIQANVSTSQIFTQIS